jgi:hypothetical protein
MAMQVPVMRALASARRAAEMQRPATISPSTRSGTSAP